MSPLISDSPCIRLSHLVDNEECFISQHSGGLNYLNNGVEYYFVELTSKRGVQYALCAYGADAKELYKLTLEILSTQRVVNVVSTMYE
jgi:hypothetical protein